MNVDLPRVSIGAYGPIARRMDDQTLVATATDIDYEIEALKRKLAAALQRKSILAAEMTDRFTSQGD